MKKIILLIVLLLFIGCTSAESLKKAIRQEYPNADIYILVDCDDIWLGSESEFIISKDGICFYVSVRRTLRGNELITLFEKNLKKLK